MKVKGGTSFFVGDDIYGKSKNGKAEGSAVRTSSGNQIIDGRAFIAKQDPIQAKKEAAQKRAMRLISRAFESETKIDENLNERRQRIYDNQKIRDEATSKINELERGRESLKDTYRVKDDSKEQEDLKLLEKEIRAKMPGTNITLTAKEQEQIDAIKENGLTEYQSRSLDMLKEEVSYVNSKYEAERNIEIENKIISTSEIERSKSQNMLVAKKQADAIMESTSKEIKGMIVEEAKENIELTQAENKEKAEEKKEKEEELQEKIDAIKERQEEERKFTEDLIEAEQYTTIADDSMKDAQQGVKEMMDKMKLIEEDIKGAAVDANL